MGTPLMGHNVGPQLRFSKLPTASTDETIGKM